MKIFENRWFWKIFNDSEFSRVFQMRHFWSILSKPAAMGVMNRIFSSSEPVDSDYRLQPTQTLRPGLLNLAEHVKGDKPQAGLRKFYLWESFWKYSAVLAPKHGSSKPLHLQHVFCNRFNMPKVRVENPTLEFQIVPTTM